MAGVRGYWKCQRVANGLRCGASNPNRKRLCAHCGKPRRPRKKPAHMAALEQDYQAFIELNGGEHCGICGAPPKNRRLYRDHAHDETRNPRGLLCFRCNRVLWKHANGEWAQAAADYLKRAEARQDG